MDKAQRVKSLLGGALALLAVALGPTWPARAQPEPRWISQLPSSADVVRSIRGADAADTTMRQQTALRVLCKYIEAMTGANRFHTELMPPAAARRLQEYEDAWGKVPGHSAATLEQTYRNEGTYAFQKATLDALVDKASAEAYWNTPAGRKVIAQTQREAAQATARAEAATSERQASAAAAAALARYAKDIDKAHAAGLSTKVFDLPLGEPLAVPECAPGIAVLLRSPEKTCRNSLLTELTGWTEVALGKDKRPSWVTSAGVTLDRGILLGMAIATTDDDPDDQLAALRAKYRAPTRVDKKTGALEWELPGLFVRYELRSAIPAVPNTVTGTTAGGITYFNVGPNAFATYARANLPNLFIMTDTLHKAKLAAAQRRKEQEPGL